MCDMAGKALEASGKRVMKYSRDGAVERNLAESSETRISGRAEDAVLKVEHTDERFNAHGTVPEQPETEQKHRRHNPSDVQEQPQNTENGQSNSDLKFEDKTFKFDDTDIPAPAANEPVPVETPAADETPAVPDNGEQQPETPQSIVAAQVVADHSDDTDEIPQGSFIIENLFAEFTAVMMLRQVAQSLINSRSGRTNSLRPIPARSARRGACRKIRTVTAS